MKRAKIRKRLWTYKGKTEDRWVVSWRDLKGKPREKWLHNKRHAEAYASKIDRELADHVHVADRGSGTFGQVCEAWLKHCEQRHRSKNRDLAGGTLRRYQLMTRKHVLPHFGKMNLNKVRSIEVQNFINEKAETLAHSTVFGISSLVWEVFAFAVQQNLLPRNPMKDRPVRIPGQPNKVGADDIPSVEDVRKLMLYLSGPRPVTSHINSWSNRRTAYVLMAFCGIRIGECLGLQWENIDFAANEINLKHNLSDVDGLKAPKSKAGIRTLPMNAIVVQALRDHLEFSGQRKRREPMFANKGKGYVICGRHGGPIRYQDIWNTHQDDMKRAWLVDQDGAPNFTFHKLRHFAGSVWLASGMRIQDVSWLLGHETIQTTMNTYAHQLKDDGHAREVIANLVARFSGVPSATAIEPPRSTIEATAIAEVREAPAVQAIPAPEPSQLASDVIQVPDNAPAWLGKMVELLQGGWSVFDAADHVGIKSYSAIAGAFRKAGLPKANVIARNARKTKFQEAIEHGHPISDSADQVGVSRDTGYNWAREYEVAEIEGNQLEYNDKSSRHRRIITRKTRGNQLKLL